MVKPRSVDRQAIINRSVTTKNLHRLVDDNSKQVNRRRNVSNSSSYRQGILTVTKPDAPKKSLKQLMNMCGMGLVPQK